MQIVHALFFSHIKLHIFLNAHTCELVCHPFPCLNKVMAVSLGEEGRTGTNGEWSEIWVAGA